MRIANGLTSAYRTTPPFSHARGRTEPQKLGLRYERAVRDAFRNVSCLREIEHNPWYGFSDRSGGGLCSPDLLLWHNDGCLIVAEIKLTWVPDALMKLMDLYIPVIERCWQPSELCIHPLVVVKHVTPETPKAAPTVETALHSKGSVLHWLGRGAITW